MTSRSGPDMVVTSTPALDSVPRTPLSLLVVDDSIASRGHTAQLLQTHWGAGRTARCRFSLWLLTAHPPNPSWALCIRSCLSVYPCAEKDSQKEEGRGGGGREGNTEGEGTNPPSDSMFSPIRHPHPHPKLKLSLIVTQLCSLWKLEQISKKSELVTMFLSGEPWA